MTHWFESLNQEPFFGGNVVFERSLRWEGKQNNGDQQSIVTGNTNWTYLKNINTLPRDVAVDLVLVVEMSSEHLGRLIHGMFYLHRDTTTGLRLFDKLRTDN